LAGVDPEGLWLIRFDPRTYRYRFRRRDQAAIEQLIKEICQTRVRFGYRRVHVLLRCEGWDLNEKKTYRIYKELGMQLRNKTPKRRVKAKPGLTLSRTTSVNENWVDPVVGVRAQFELSEKWSGTVFADYGGFRSGSETWQVLLTADYNINENWVARVGYRHIAVDHDLKNGTAFSFDQSGPMFGATYRF